IRHGPHHICGHRRRPAELASHHRVGGRHLNPEPSPRVEAPSLPAPWGPSAAVLTAVFAFVAFLFIDVIVLLPVINKGKESTIVLAFGTVATLIWQASIIGIARWTAKRHGGGWETLGLRRPFPWARSTDWARVARITFAGFVVAEGLTI